jgi:transcriptional regulator with XRE-family HTH domain
MATKKRPKKPARKIDEHAIRERLEARPHEVVKRDMDRSMGLPVEPAVIDEDASSGVFAHRFRKFLEDATAQMGGVRGAKQEIARKLEITPEHLSRIAAGARAPSIELARRAGAAFGFDAELYFFASRTTPELSFSDFHPGSAEDAMAIARRVMLAMAEPGAVNPGDVLALASAVLRLPLVQMARKVAATDPTDPHLSLYGSRLAIELVHFNPRQS